MAGGHGRPAILEKDDSRNGLDYPFSESIPEDLQCGICLGPAIESNVTQECGHLFCRGCILQAMEAKKECPTCRRPITIDEIRKDVRTQRKIHALGVHCRNKRGGCAWKGALSEFERHAEKCEYATVKCPFAPHGCDEDVTRRSLQQHIQNSMSNHLILMCQALTKLQEDNLTLLQELHILQRYDKRFIWVIPNFGSKKGPVYSQKFMSKGHQWYLGVDFEGPDQHAGVYLFAEGHTKRVNFKLILFHQDPSKDKMHIVNDWTVDYKGKGWGPLKFIDRSNLNGTGYIVGGCVRIAAEIDGEPYD
eukprot:Sspe_Gene.89269::Locus_61066_Transcript_1_1_Confidence_1.000_Length_1237::g.89269::m.89269